MTDLTTQDYDAFKEEWDSFETEAKFDLTLNSLKWAHKGGELIRSWFKGELDEAKVQQLRLATGKSRATIFNWVQLYDLHPDLDLALEKQGKNISMTALLGRKQEPKELPGPHEHEAICKICKISL